MLPSTMAKTESKKKLDLSITLQDEDTLYEINVHTTNIAIIKEFAFTFNQTNDMHMIPETFSKDIKVNKDKNKNKDLKDLRKRNKDVK